MLAYHENKEVLACYVDALSCSDFEPCTQYSVLARPASDEENASVRPYVQIMVLHKRI